MYVIFFNDPATTDIYALPLPVALPFAPPIPAAEENARVDLVSASRRNCGRVASPCGVVAGGVAKFTSAWARLFWRSGLTRMRWAKPASCERPPKAPVKGPLPAPLSTKKGSSAEPPVVVVAADPAGVAGPPCGVWGADARGHRRDVGGVGGSIVEDA